MQENCIDLVGRIADRGAEFVPAREWMRICFELLEMLKAHKKGIRRATVNTFGYIAKAIGPQDVLVTLLNNLKVQERQNRVCTTVAIAIVAETCSPFTVLPALMNEYKVPHLPPLCPSVVPISFRLPLRIDLSWAYLAHLLHAQRRHEARDVIVLILLYRACLWPGDFNWWESCLFKHMSIGFSVFLLSLFTGIMTSIAAACWVQACASIAFSLQF